MKDKFTTLILVFFLGWMGAHQFYLGQSSKGILYALFFWTGIPFVISFFDFFIILLMPDEAFQTRYNQTFFSVADKASIADELEKLHIIKEKGIIDEEEFKKRKEKLLK